MRIKVTESGREQFLAAVAYIYRQNPTAARKFKKTVQEKLKRLETFPNSGWVIPEFLQLAQREVVVAPYRFFYRVVGEMVWVVAVWRDSQRPSEPMMGE